MGNLPSRISCFFHCRPPSKILMAGIDAAGKTSILYKFLSPKTEVKSIIPTMGFNVETLNLQGTAITAWDVGGRDKIRPLLKHYYKGTDAVVFVVDSNDHDRMEYAKTELKVLLNDAELEGLPVLLFCNKQDLPDSKSVREISVLFQDVFGYYHEKWQAVGCSAATGEGLFEGFTWLTQTLLAKPVEKIEANDASGIGRISPSEKKAPSSPEISSPKDMLGYDPTDEGSNLTLQRFEAIKCGTNCHFAKASRLWGGPNLNGKLSLEDQAKAIANPLADFVRRSNMGQNLDGFCIELDEPLAREGGPKGLGECVRQLLTALSDLDPAGEYMMRKNYIGKRGWRFRFGHADIFVTTFAPCYSSTSSRHGFGTPHAFALLQPEASFARHNLPSDTATTHWDHPKTVRDRTRAEFKAAGRAYYIPDTTQYPPAEHIVKPLRDDGTTFVRWWRQDDESNRKPRH